MRRTNVHSRKSRGLTLMELMVGISLSGIVMAGMLSAYTFLGRNLTGIGRLQEFDRKSQNLLVQFGRDIGSASEVSSTSASGLTLTLPSGAVTYAWNSGSRIFTRAAGGVTQTMLSNVSAVDIKYYSRDGDLNPTAISVKQVQLNLTGTLGTDKTTTYVTRQVASAILPLTSKALLQ